MKTRASTSPGSGGNLGIMDIIAALQWTKDNIGAFGGDPTRVTIVGHDTGAALANLVFISKNGRSKYAKKKPFIFHFYIPNRRVLRTHIICFVHDKL